MSAEQKQKKIPIEGFICFLLLLFITLVMGMEVVARYIFNHSLRWSGELARYLFIWFIFISSSYAIIEKTHIRIESLQRVFPKVTRPYLEFIGNIFWFIFSIFIAYVGFTYSFEMIESGNISTAMRIPVGFIYISIPIGYTLMALRLITDGYKVFRSNKPVNLSEE
ncbi:TRAP transporter small permease [Bacillus sp. FJAT-29814]|uniref:TRAP transporter small permease n=1 Tax=Bacillus sp. FJAT-29814 TaxID=1729688 RepID=UPI000832E42F|nr:TRAP transporter small permease [Bacillus sp. FJAT-29814]